jgi:hypothetical protein
MTWQNVIDARIVLTLNFQKGKTGQGDLYCSGNKSGILRQNFCLTDFYRFSRNFQRSTKNE